MTDEIMIGDPRAEKIFGGSMEQNPRQQTDVFADQNKAIDKLNSALPEDQQIEKKEPSEQSEVATSEDVTRAVEAAGFVADGTTEAFSKVVEEDGLSQGTVEKLVNVQKEYSQSYWENMAQTWDEQTREQFSEQEISDAINMFNRVVAKDNPIRQVLETTYIGNHPGLMEIFVNLSRPNRRGRF